MVKDKEEKHEMSSKFYTFYDFGYGSGSPPFKPLVQNQLRKRIEKLTKSEPEWNESDYIQHFREILLNNTESDLEKRLAHFHLVAHIDLDRCYLIWRNFHYFPFYAAKSEEYYALTNEILFQQQKFEKYLKKYNPQNKEEASFKTYLLSILKNLIKAEINLRSDWHLLCNVDINSLRKIKNFGKKLRKSLESYGLQEPNISQYIFAWQYFVPVYKNNLINNPNRTNNQKWPQPRNIEFTETTKYYNIYRFQSDAPLQVSSGKDVTAETIKKWMKICIQALRQAESILEVSRDADIYEKQIEPIDYWVNLDEQNEELVSLTKVEKVLKEEIKKIEVNLAQIRSNIPHKSRQAVMPLCYSNRLALLNQEQLASLLGINQGTISRFISQHIENPLLDILRDLLDLQLDIESYLDSFLAERFTDPGKENMLDKLLIESIKKMDEKQQYILKLYYGQKNSLKEIGLKINPQQEIDESNIFVLRNILCEVFTQKIDKQNKKYIKLWLKNYYQNIIQTILLQILERLSTLNREIIIKKYCQKMDDSEIGKLYPQCDIDQIIFETKQQLQTYLIESIKDNLSVTLDSHNSQVKSVIDNWLATLIYLEI